MQYFVTIQNEWKETFFVRFAWLFSLHLDGFCVQLQFEPIKVYNVGLERNARYSPRASPYIYVERLEFIFYFLNNAVSGLYFSIFPLEPYI